MDLFSLKGKNVVLTGGCGNLGRIMAKWLLEYEANLYIADIIDTPVEELSEYQEQGRLQYIKCDLSKTQSIREMFNSVDDMCGGLTY